MGIAECNLVIFNTIVILRIQKNICPLNLPHKNIKGKSSIWNDVYLYYSFRHILSLSIADLMLILSVVPFVSIVYAVESWPWGTGMCVLSEFMKDFSTGVSVFTLVAMSLDRFVAIVNPLRRFRGNGKFGMYHACNIWLGNLHAPNIITKLHFNQFDRNFTSASAQAICSSLYLPLYRSSYAWLLNSVIIQAYLVLDIPSKQKRIIMHIRHKQHMQTLYACHCLCLIA